jgi:hypothetical protein
MTVLTRVTKTAAYTLTALDQAVSANAASGAFTLTLPNVTTTAPDGTLFSVKKTDSSANVVTIATTSSQLIDGALTFLLTTQNQSVALLSNGTGWEIR